MQKQQSRNGSTQRMNLVDQFLNRKAGFSTHNHAFDRTPENIAALRDLSLGGAGQGSRCVSKEGYT